MEITQETLALSANRLYGYLLQEHWNGRRLIGPDSGVRFNARFGRFIKSYLGFLPWRDSYSYLQAQGYWILSSWAIHDLQGHPSASDLAISCSKYVLDSQKKEGYWEYPNPEWKGRITTVEGDFAALGLLGSYRRTGDPSFLRGAEAWWRYLVDGIGFQADESGGLAVNYFANHPTGMIPNNTTLTLLVLGRLCQAKGKEVSPEIREGMTSWLEQVQLPSGELPYEVMSKAAGVGASGQGKARDHFLCYQYNAFELLDLIEYYEVSADRRIYPIVEKLARYLSTGLTATGVSKYDCNKDKPEVSYYTAALAAALDKATAIGLGNYGVKSERAYRRILSIQRPDGNLAYFSRANYGFLVDRRSYPRNLSMILYHILLGLESRRKETIGKK